jgi:integrase
MGRVCSALPGSAVDGMGAPRARHYGGTLLAFLKVHPKVAQTILRHSQISMTMDVYTHVVGSDQRDAAAMLAELLEDPLIG